MTPEAVVAGHVPSSTDSEVSAHGTRPGNPQFPFPRFPIWPGIGDSRRESGEDIPDSRFGQNRESGNPRFPMIWPKIGKSGVLIPCEYQTRSGGQMVPLILENAEFRPPTHVSRGSGCSWQVPWARGPNPQFPFPRFLIWPGIGEGIPDSRLGIPDSRLGIPDSRLGIPDSRLGIPDSRFGQNRENGESPIPNSAGIGKQGIPPGRAVSRFGRDRESGTRWRRAGDFLVCMALV